jgi:hypothetical protein
MSQNERTERKIKSVKVYSYYSTQKLLALSFLFQNTVYLFPVKYCIKQMSIAVYGYGTLSH